MSGADKAKPAAEAAPERAAPQQTRESPWLKMVVEIGPLILFFLANSFFGIFVATGVFMLAIIASMIFSWRVRGHIPPMLWFTGAVVTVFGGLTIYLHDPRFVKIKPTIIYSVFAGVLLFGLARGRSYIKLVMAAAFPPLDDAGWMKLARNWALFFAAAAILNEIVWRNSSTDFWVSFKLFGFMPLTFLFAMAQMPVIMKHQAGGEKDGGDDSGSA